MNEEVGTDHVHFMTADNNLILLGMDSFCTCSIAPGTLRLVGHTANCQPAVICGPTACFAPCDQNPYGIVPCGELGPFADVPEDELCEEGHQSKNYDEDRTDHQTQWRPPAQEREQDHLVESCNMFGWMRQIIINQAQVQIGFLADTA